MYKIKLLFLGLLICVFTCISCIVYAFPNESNGFRQYHFGMNRNEVLSVLNKDVVIKKDFFFNDNYNSFMEIEVDNDYISGFLIKDQTISLEFIQDKLMVINITVIEDSNLWNTSAEIREALKNNLISLYGDPKITKEYFGGALAYEWKGKKTQILLRAAYPSNKEAILLIRPVNYDDVLNNMEKAKLNDKDYQGW